MGKSKNCLVKYSCYWRPIPLPWRERNWLSCLVDNRHGSCAPSSGFWQVDPAEKKGSGFDCVPWEHSSHCIEQSHSTGRQATHSSEPAPSLACGLACFSSFPWSEGRRVFVLLEGQVTDCLLCGSSACHVIVSSWLVKNGQLW